MPVAGIVYHYRKTWSQHIQVADAGGRHREPSSKWSSYKKIFLLIPIKGLSCIYLVWFSRFVEFSFGVFMFFGLFWISSHIDLLFYLPNFLEWSSHLTSNWWLLTKSCDWHANHASWYRYPDYCHVVLCFE